MAVINSLDFVSKIINPSSLAPSCPINSPFSFQTDDFPAHSLLFIVLSCHVLIYIALSVEYEEYNLKKYKSCPPDEYTLQCTQLLRDFNCEWK
jgi:hypothetical protein